MILLFSPVENIDSLIIAFSYFPLFLPPFSSPTRQNQKHFRSIFFPFSGKSSYLFFFLLILPFLWFFFSSWSKLFILVDILYLFFVDVKWWKKKHIQIRCGGRVKKICRWFCFLRERQSKYGRTRQGKCTCSDIYTFLVSFLYFFRASVWPACEKKVSCFSLLLFSSFFFVYVFTTHEPVNTFFLILLLSRRKK